MDCTPMFSAISSVVASGCTINLLTNCHQPQNSFCEVYCCPNKQRIDFERDSQSHDRCRATNYVPQDISAVPTHGQGHARARFRDAGSALLAGFGPAGGNAPAGGRAAFCGGGGGPPRTP